MTEYTGTVYCSLCGKAFNPRSTQAFIPMMRKHRERDHPDNKGPIYYLDEPPKKVPVAQR